jgi:hypothetical protein
MIQWRPFSLPITIALAVGSFLWYQHRHAGELEQARTEVAVANHQADLAIDIMSRAISYADSVQALADSAEARANLAAAKQRAQAPRVAAIVAAAPDTCQPAIQALQGQLASSQAESESWHDAYDEQKAATARLEAAAGPLVDASQAQTDASQHLSKASKPSFLGRLVPKVGVNATIGVDPLQPEEGIKKVVGVGVSWSF